MSDDLISRQAAIELLCRALHYSYSEDYAVTLALNLPSAQPEVIRCGECKHWRQQTNYAGASLSFGFCESDDMWRSLYGDTCEVEHIDTDEDFYCGYAERKTDE